MNKIALIIILVFCLPILFALMRLIFKIVNLIGKLIMEIFFAILCHIKANKYKYNISDTPLGMMLFDKDGSKITNEPIHSYKLMYSIIKFCDKF